MIVEEENKISEQAYKILQIWIQKEGNNATYSVLAQALLDRTVMRKGVLDRYCLASESKSN